MNSFLGTSQLELLICNRKVDVKKEKISWLETREIMLAKTKPFSIFLRKSFKGEYAEIDITKRRIGRPLTGIAGKLSPLWPNGKAIAVPKLHDLQSVMDLIPGDAKEFYNSLFADSNVEDDVDGFSGVPDIEIE